MTPDPAPGTDQPPALTAEQARQVVEAAARAPSVHNTQPWRFAADDTAVSVYADRTRALSQQDPEGRELMISCGAATLHALLGVRGLGREAALHWLPEPGEPDLLARVLVGRQQDMSDSERRLLEAVAVRHTDRSAFAPEPVPDRLIEQLRRAVESEGCWLAVPERAEDIVELEVLASRADRLLRQDAAFGQEIAAWVRPGERPAEGVPADALPGHGQGRGTSLPLRDFDPVAAGPAPEQPPAAERPLLLVLGTDGDSPPEWLQAGAALAAVLLTATAAGLVANPQTAVLEVPSLRQQLGARLGLVGRPQMLLRVGWPTGAGSPRTGRRPVPDLVEPARGD